MPKLLIRIVTFLLVPCLIADPARALAEIQSRGTSDLLFPKGFSVYAHERHFLAEAISAPLTGMQEPQPFSPGMRCEIIHQTPAQPVTRHETGMSRFQFMAVMGGALTSGASVLSAASRALRISRQERPHWNEPWHTLAEPLDADLKPLPYDKHLEYLDLSLPGDHSQIVVDKHGHPLGQTKKIYRISTFDSEETVGYLDGPDSISNLRQFSDETLYDRSGKPARSITLSPLGRDGRPLPGALPNNLVKQENFTVEWKERHPIPLYEIAEFAAVSPAQQRSADNAREPSRLKHIGYLYYKEENYALVLNVDGTPMAAMAPAKLLSDPNAVDPQGKPKAKAILKPASLAERFFIGTPSKMLLHELHNTVAHFDQNSHPNGSWLRFMLAAREVELEAILGMPGSLYIDPARSRALADLLDRAPASRLGNLEREDNRRVLWDAMAQAHPAWAIARVAAIRLGLNNDPAFLRETWKQFQEMMQLHGSSNPPDLRLVTLNLGEVDDESKQALADVLRYNALQTPAEIDQYFKATQMVMDDISEPHQAYSLFLATRLSGAGTASGILMHKGVALQRLGYKINFVIPGPVDQKVDETTKRRTYPLPFLVCEGPDAQTFIMEASGEQRSIGAPPTDYPGGTVVLPLDLHPEASLDRRLGVRVWDEALRQLYGVEKASLIAKQLLTVSIEQAMVGSMDQRGDHLISNQLDEFAARGGIVYDVRSLSPKETVTMKVTYWETLQRLPAKFRLGMKKLILRSDNVLTESSEPVVEDGKIREQKGFFRFPGFYRADEKAVEMAGGRRVATHESFHHFAMTVVPQTASSYVVNPVTLFNRISWEEAGGQWRLRNEADPIKHFKDPHDLRDPGEDLADTGQLYVDDGVGMRHAARAAMQTGDFTLSVKYLWAKYIALLDSDGLALEYELSPKSPGMTFEEVLAEMQKRTGNLPGPPRVEAERLRSLLLEIQTFWKTERDTGRIAGFRQPNDQVQALNAAAREQPGLGGEFTVRALSRAGQVLITSIVLSGLALFGQQPSFNHPTTNAAQGSIIPLIALIVAALITIWPIVFIPYAIFRSWLSGLDNPHSIFFGGRAHRWVRSASRRYPFDRTKWALRRLSGRKYYRMSEEISEDVAIVPVPLLKMLVKDNDYLAVPDFLQPLIEYIRIHEETMLPVIEKMIRNSETVERDRLALLLERIETPSSLALYSQLYPGSRPAVQLHSLENLAVQGKDGQEYWLHVEIAGFDDVRIVCAASTPLDHAPTWTIGGGMFSPTTGCRLKTPNAVGFVRWIFADHDPYRTQDLLDLKDTEFAGAPGQGLFSKTLQKSVTLFPERSLVAISDVVEEDAYRKLKHGESFRNTVFGAAFAPTGFTIQGVVPGIQLYGPAVVLSKGTLLSPEQTQNVVRDYLLTFWYGNLGNAINVLLQNGMAKRVGPEVLHVLDPDGLFRKEELTVISAPLVSLREAVSNSYDMSGGLAMAFEDLDEHQRDEERHRRENVEHFERRAERVIFSKPSFSSEPEAPSARLLLSDERLAVIMGMSDHDRDVWRRNILLRLRFPDAIQPDIDRWAAEAQPRGSPGESQGDNSTALHQTTFGAGLALIFSGKFLAPMLIASGLSLPTVVGPLLLMAGFLAMAYGLRINNTWLRHVGRARWTMMVPNTSA